MYTLYALVHDLITCKLKRLLDLPLVTSSRSPVLPLHALVTLCQKLRDFFFPHDFNASVGVSKIFLGIILSYILNVVCTLKSRSYCSLDDLLSFLLQAVGTVEKDRKCQYE